MCPRFRCSGTCLNYLVSIHRNHLSRTPGVMSYPTPQHTLFQPDTTDTGVVPTGEEFFCCEKKYPPRYAIYPRGTGFPECSPRKRRCNSPTYLTSPPGGNAVENQYPARFLIPPGPLELLLINLIHPGLATCVFESDLYVDQVDHQLFPFFCVIPPGVGFFPGT